MVLNKSYHFLAPDIHCCKEF